MRLDTRKGRRDLRYRYVISYRDNGSFCLLFRSFFDCRSTWIHKATATSVLPSKQNHHEIYIDCDGGQRRRYCVAWRRLLLSRRNARRINHDSTRKRKHRVAIRCSSPTKENRPRAAAGEKNEQKMARIATNRSLLSFFHAIKPLQIRRHSFAFLLRLSSICSRFFSTCIFHTLYLSLFASARSYVWFFAVFYDTRTRWSKWYILGTVT